MQPGETNSIQTAFGMLGAQYSLSMTLNSDGQVVYLAEVPVQFHPADGVNRPSEVIARVRRTADECLSQVSSKMTGPSGESLQIRLNEVGGSYAKQIRVTDRPLRNGEGHSLFWTTDVSWGCPQVVHEVLHLVGLVDAYLDPSGTYDCRAEGPKDAIMVAPVAAFQSVGWMGGAVTRNSLLYPAEFNAVVAPHCNVSQQYALCASNAYRNSRRHGCQPIPGSCYSDSGAWYSAPSQSGAQSGPISGTQPGSVPGSL